MQVQPLLQAIPSEALFPIHDAQPRLLVYDNEGMTHDEQVRMAALQANATQYVLEIKNGAKVVVAQLDESNDVFETGDSVVLVYGYPAQLIRSPSI